MDLNEKSVDAATETSKLLITLSTGVVAFCATVVNVKVSETTVLTPVSQWQKYLLAGSWIVLLISIGLGVWTQLAITHVLSEAAKNKDANIWSMKIRFPFMLQICGFLIGLLALVVYGTLRVFW